MEWTILTISRPDHIRAAPLDKLQVQTEWHATRGTAGVRANGCTRLSEVTLFSSLQFTVHALE